MVWDGSKEQVVRLEKEVTETKVGMEDLRKKLLACLRRADTADAALLKIEGKADAFSPQPCAP